MADHRLDPTALLCLQTRTCLQLRAVLQANGSGDMLQKLYSEYLLRRLDSKKDGAKSKGGRHGGRGGRGGRTPAVRSVADILHGSYIHIMDAMSRRLVILLWWATDAFSGK